MTKIIKNKLTKGEVAAMERVLFNGQIVVVDHIPDVYKALSYLNRQAILGIDTETRPSFRAGKSYDISLLQISSEDTCFLFRLNKIGMPKVLVEFLKNDILKIGLSLKDDFMMFHRLKDGMDVESGNYIDLQHYVRIFGIQDLSLQKIYANLFGQKISKSQRLTNWNAEELSESQMLYAATDAWACLKIYKLLSELEKTGDYELVVVPEEVKEEKQDQ